MSGAEQQIGRPLGRETAHDCAETVVDAVVCTKRMDGTIRISTPMHFDPSCSAEPAWGPEHERAYNFVAANILYGFLQSDVTPAAIKSHLMTLTDRIHDPDEPERQNATRAYLLDISRSFSEDFISTLPVGVGIIPGDQIQDWLSRSVDVPHTKYSDLTFDEQKDQYVADTVVAVSELPFEHHGFVCARTAKKPTYNIAQKIWLQRQLRMDWRGPAVACESLAANVIDRFIDAQPPTTPLRRQINGAVGDFYSPFADDFLHTMPRNGGQIPVSVMSRWFNRHL